MAMLIIFKRELLAYRRSLIFTIGSIILLPMLLFLLVAMPLYKIIPAVNQLNYLNWVSPGIWTLSATFLAFVVAFSGMRSIRVPGETMDIYAKSPVSLWTVLGGMVSWSFLLGVIQFAVAIVLISVVTNEFIIPAKMIKLILQVLPMLLVFSVIGNLLGSWVDRVETQSLITFVTFLFFAIGAGSFIPLDYFPESYVHAISYIPLVDGISQSHQILFHHEGSPATGVITLGIGAILFMINGIACNSLYRKG